MAGPLSRAPVHAGRARLAPPPRSASTSAPVVEIVATDATAKEGPKSTTVTCESGEIMRTALVANKVRGTGQSAAAAGT